GFLDSHASTAPAPAGARPLARSASGKSHVAARFRTAEAGSHDGAGQCASKCDLQAGARGILWIDRHRAPAAPLGSVCPCTIRRARRLAYAAYFFELAQRASCGRRRALADRMRESGEPVARPRRGTENGNRAAIVARREPWKNRAAVAY